DKDELKNQSRLIADSEEDGATNKEEYSGSQIDDAEFYELNDTFSSDDLDAVPCLTTLSFCFSCSNCLF
ncbi:hypothetical protein IDG46_30590, partial [Staphylococcus sp. EG-SA-13]|nr:hypothetical protein [Staphylococcus sp. EG-SA-13]